MADYKSFQTICRKDVLDDIYHIKRVLMRLDIELELLAVGNSVWKKKLKRYMNLWTILQKMQKIKKTAHTELGSSRDYILLILSARTFTILVNVATLFLS